MPDSDEFFDDLRRKQNQTVTPVGPPVAERSNRALILAIVACTIVIAAVLIWPRFMPRYVEDPARPGIVVDRWTDAECRIFTDVCSFRPDTDRDPIFRYGLNWK